MSQSREVGSQVTNSLFVSHFDKIVKPIAMDRDGSGTQPFQQMLRNESWRRRFDGKIEFDLITRTSRREQAAQRVKDQRPIGVPDSTGLPQRVSGRESRMTTQFNFDLGSKPAQVERTVGPLDDEGRLGEVHFARHRLKPRVVRPTSQRANGCGVSSECTIGKSIDYKQRNGHGRKTLSDNSEIRYWTCPTEARFSAVADLYFARP